jgi:hypothetical protein
MLEADEVALVIMKGENGKSVSDSKPESAVEVDPFATHVGKSINISVNNRKNGAVVNSGDSDEEVPLPVGKGVGYGFEYSDYSSVSSDSGKGKANNWGGATGQGKTDVVRKGPIPIIKAVEGFGTPGVKGRTGPPPPPLRPNPGVRPVLPGNIQIRSRLPLKSNSIQVGLPPPPGARLIQPGGRRMGGPIPVGYVKVDEDNGAEKQGQENGTNGQGPVTSNPLKRPLVPPSVVVGNSRFQVQRPSNPNLNPNQKGGTDEPAEKQTVPPRPGFIGSQKLEVQRPGNANADLGQKVGGTSQNLGTKMQRDQVPYKPVLLVSERETETLLGEEPRRLRAGAADLATKLVTERLNLEKPNENVEGKVVKEVVGKGKGTGVEHGRGTKLSLPDSDQSDNNVKLIGSMQLGRLAVERRPEHVKEGEWEVRPVSKRKPPSSRFVGRGYKH